MTALYRDATHDDLDALVEMARLMAAESPRFSRLVFSAEKLRTTLAGVIDSPTGFLVVAEEEDRLVGGLAAICAPHWMSDDLVASDLGVFVRPDARGCAARVRALVQRYVAWADQQGAVLVQLGISTGVSPDRTKSLYELAGMRFAGYLMEA